MDISTINRNGGYVGYYGALNRANTAGGVTQSSIEGSKAQNSEKTGAAEGAKECQTCKRRKYKDQSDDPTVSFQSAQSIPTGMVYGAVAAHENEHVRNEQFRAKAEGREVVFQSVSIHTSICPECGRVYISGGTTRTVTKNASNDAGNSPAKGDENSYPGMLFDKAG